MPQTPKTFDERCAAWVQKLNRVMMEGARLAHEAESANLTGQSELAMLLYQRFSERQLDAEIRHFQEGQPKPGA